jgi:alpha-glucosidase
VSNKKWHLLLTNSEQMAIEKRVQLQPYDAWVFEEIAAVSADQS